jgi:hypothetical protein
MVGYNVLQNYKFYFFILIFCIVHCGCVQAVQSNTGAEKNKMDSLVAAFEKLNKKQHVQESILQEKIKEWDKMENQKPTDKIQK